MLAETTVNLSNAMTFWQLLQIASFLSGVITPIGMLLVLVRNNKQRREVSFEFEPVARKDYDEQRKLRDAEIARLREDIERNRESGERERKQSAAGIYKKIDETRAELSADLQSVRQELGENQRNLPGEIVALLKNTNAI
jgi:hypothetical protein